MKIILYGLPQEVSQILNEKLSFLRDDLVIVEEEGRLFELVVRFDASNCKIVFVTRSSYLLDHSTGSSLWITFDKLYEPQKRGVKICLNFDKSDEARVDAERKTPYAENSPIQLLRGYHEASNQESWIDCLITQLLEQYYTLKRTNLMEIYQKERPASLFYLRRW